MGLLGILGFFKRYWKFFAIAAVVIGAYFFIQNAITDYGNKRFEEGVVATKGKVKAEIAKKDRKNRELEKKLDDALINHVTDIETINKKRGKEETAFAERAMENINKIPFIDNAQCDVTPEVLNDRNSIRRLGPNL